MMLESGSDAHSSEDEDITGTNNIQWTNSTHYQPSVPVVHRFTVNPICETRAVFYDLLQKHCELRLHHIFRDFYS